MKKLRVLWLLKNFGAGGAERLLLEIADYMPDVTFHVMGVHRGNAELLPEYRDRGFSLTILAASPLDPRWVTRFRRQVARVRPDIVHAHLPLPGVGSRVGMTRLRVPLVYTEHSLPAFYHPVTGWLNRLTISRNSAVIAVSDQVANGVRKGGLRDSAIERMRVIPNGINVDRVRADAHRGDPVGIEPGSYGAIMSLIRPGKGPDTLVKAAAILRGHLGSRCVIVGDGEYLSTVRHLAEALGVSDRVDFVGRRMDVRAIMAKLSIVVVPSRVEGLPISLLECMALSRPIVATRVGGIPEVIHDGRTGLLVPPESPEAIAAAVRSLYQDSALADRLGSAAAREVEARWTAERTAQAHTDLYFTLARR
jgi:glycosyltransferase involved in cell wall biosynthesis